MLKIVRLFLEGLLFIGLFVSCKKDPQSSPAPTPPPGPTPTTPLPAIASFTITNLCDRVVRITGSNFNNDISKDSIFFGSTKGIIDSANSTQIIARYPNGNIFGKIILYIDGLTAASTDVINVALPVIISFSPSLAGPGTIDTIKGQNFNPDLQSDSVFFGSAKAEILSATSTQIIARVPQDGKSGAIKVFSNCQSAVSAVSFTYSNKGVVFVSANAGMCYAIDIASGNTIWTAATNSKAFSAPSYDKGIIYIGSTDANDLNNNYLFALNAQNGKEIWKYHGGPYDCIPAIDNGTVYDAGFDKQLVAIDANTGQKLWNFTAGDYFRIAGPTYFNGKVYVRNDDGYFYCVNAATGKMVWRNFIWPTGNPAAVNGTIYISGPYGLYALDPDDGSTKWFLSSDFSSGQSPMVVNGVLYIAFNSHRIYAINASTGTVIWNIEASWWVGSSVYVADNILYVHSGDGVLGAVDASNGNILWAKLLGFTNSGQFGESPVVANGMLFVGDDFGTLNVLNAKTGETIWTKSIGGGYPMLSSPCIVDSAGVVYHGGDSGNQQ
jgi:outer membrane protein assembly factor BamB